MSKVNTQFYGGASTRSFGRLVRTRRRALDMTQKELAQQVGYSIVTIRKIESDERRPSRHLAELLASCLELGPDERHRFVTMARVGGGSAPDLPTEAGTAAAWQAAPAPARPPSNLVTPLTRLIGREREVTIVRAQLSQSHVRLVTLVGPPGIGKSRLGQQIALDLRDAFPDGVFWVGLGAIGDPALVPPTTAKALGLKETATSSLTASLVEFLAHRRLLLLFDNFEHIGDAAPFVAELLTACPGVTALATSRAPLHIRGEALFPVPPLALPDPAAVTSADAIAGCAAVQLFVERARAVKPNFALTDADATAVAAVCAGLDGLPLAIELVAAKANVWTPQTLLDRLHDRLALLTDGPRDLPVHQQTLRGAIEWSYNLLDAAQQTLFARLSVLVGGCSLRTVEEVANADGDLPTTVLDGLTALVDQNLLRQEDRTDGERYFTFFQTIREYALERLVERGEEDVVRARFAACYLRLAETASARLVGADQEAWMDRLDAEHDNVRAALEYFVHLGDQETAWRMVAALWKFWHIRSHQTEGRRWILLTLGLEGARCDAVRAQALHGAGWIALDQGELSAAKGHFDESLALFRTLGDVRGIAEALHGVGMMSQAAGDDARAATLFEESLVLYRDLGDDEGIAWSLDHLGAAALSLDDYEQADALFGESLAIFRRLRHTWGTAISLHHQGLAGLARGDLIGAEELVNESLDIFREVENGWGVAASISQLGYVALAGQDHARAEANFRTSLSLSQAEEDPDTIAGSFVGLASAALARQRLEIAASLLGAFEGLAGASKIRVNPFARRVYARERAALRDRSEQDSVARAWARGRSLSLRQAVAFALAPTVELAAG